MALQRYPTIIGYQLTEKVGGGGFSTVYCAVNVSDHRVAACKVIAITEETTEKDRKTIDKEMKIHSALKHPNILEFINAVVVELKHKAQYVPGIYMLLEFAAGGDLFDKIAPDIGVGEDVAQIYFKQLVSGISYIHGQGVCHRDLKPENILLDVTGALKISDFGLSSVFMLKESGKTRTLTERCGSLPYVAPELNLDGPYRAEPIDVWGIGVILFTLLAGNTPWDEPTQHSREFRLYLSGEFVNTDPWNRISSDALSLITGLLTIDPTRRMTLNDVHQHPWCTRSSQLSGQGVAELAEKLAESLRKNGDLELAAPDMFANTDAEDDGDQIMQSATHTTQFTQSLMLFSQTQSGRRYTPHLTRFYASTDPSDLFIRIQKALEILRVKCKDGSDGDTHRLRVGGFDRRNTAFKGWIQLENFTYQGHRGSFCIMQRDVGNPISWRQLWKAIIEAEPVAPFVLRK